MASSACTFGVLSITQPLFKKGASAEASFAFSFASTNLVIKLGLLVYGKLGWPLLVAERLGGSLLVSILMELVFRKLGWIPPRLSAEGLMSFLEVKFDLTLVMTVLLLLGTFILQMLRYPTSNR